MNTTKSLLLVAIIAIVAAGCASAKHTRTAKDGTTDITSIHTFLSTTAFKNFSETLRDGTNGYSRTVRVAEAGTQTEIEKLEPLIGTAVSSAVSAAVKGVKP